MWFCVSSKWQSAEKWGLKQKSDSVYIKKNSKRYIFSESTVVKYVASR